MAQVMACNHEIHSELHGHLHNENHLELGQNCLQIGDLDGAVQHLEKAIDDPHGSRIDAHLLLAEALWQQSGGAGTDAAIPHYEAAESLARESGDSTKEGMVCLGYGFALSHLGQHVAARTKLVRSKELAQADGNEQAIAFIDQMLKRVGREASSGPDAIREMWQQFAESFARRKPAVVFLRGSISSPLDEASWRGVTQLRSVGCTSIDVMNVSAEGINELPEGLQDLKDSPHLSLPMLYVGGSNLEGWLEMPEEELKEHLLSAGVVLSAPQAEKGEPCHGTAAFSQGLEEWETALVELVAKDGVGDWAYKAEALKRRGFLGSNSSAALEEDAVTVEAAWNKLSPLVKEKLEQQPDMPCGHSCNTCPTRHDCQLHDAVGDKKVVDIEDLA